MILKLFFSIDRNIKDQYHVATPQVILSTFQAVVLFLLTVSICTFTSHAYTKFQFYFQNSRSQVSKHIIRLNRSSTINRSMPLFESVTFARNFSIIL